MRPGPQSRAPSALPGSHRITRPTQPRHAPPSLSPSRTDPANGLSTHQSTVHYRRWLRSISRYRVASARGPLRTPAWEARLLTFRLGGRQGLARGRGKPLLGLKTKASAGKLVEYGQGGSLRKGKGPRWPRRRRIHWAIFKFAHGSQLYHPYFTLGHGLTAFWFSWTEAGHLSYTEPTPRQTEDGRSFLVYDMHWGELLFMRVPTPTS